MMQTENTNRSANRRGIYTQEFGQQPTYLTAKSHRNDLLSRREVCDLMLWSQDELTWYQRNAGLPSIGNRFSRAALQQWRIIGVQFDDSENAGTRHYRLFNRRVS